MAARAVRACESLGLQSVQLQQGADLGERMLHALRDALQRYSQVILVGSDCPWLTPGGLLQAAHALRTAHVVLQPATDGGYVLIGARKVGPDLFEDVPWGSDGVFAETARRLEEGGYRWTALEALPDIDRPEDLPACEALRCRS